MPPYLFIGPGGPVDPSAATGPGAAIELGAPGVLATGGIQLSQAHSDYHAKTEDPTALGTSGRAGGQAGGDSSGSQSSLNVQDRLASTLEDIFHKKVVTDPLVKALLDKHGDVDLKQLASELSEFSNGIGANQREN